MKEYLITIYYGVKPQRISFTSLFKAVRYAWNKTPKGDVWQLEILKNNRRVFLTRTHKGKNR